MAPVGQVRNVYTTAAPQAALNILSLMLRVRWGQALTSVAAIDTAKAARSLDGSEEMLLV